MVTKYICMYVYLCAVCMHVYTCVCICISKNTTVYVVLLYLMEELRCMTGGH